MLGDSLDEDDEGDDGPSLPPPLLDANVGGKGINGAHLSARRLAPLSLLAAPCTEGSKDSRGVADETDIVPPHSRGGCPPPPTAASGHSASAA